MGKVGKSLFVIMGFILLGIGVLGIFLPILPSVKFLLLASFCFVKGSKHFDRWFKGTTIYKKYLEDYVKHRGMTVKRKCTILLTASALLAIPIFTLDILPMRIFLIFLIIGKYIYLIFVVKTLKEPKK